MIQSVLHENTEPYNNSNKHPEGPRFTEVNFSDNEDMYYVVETIRNNEHWSLRDPIDILQDVSKTIPALGMSKFFVGVAWGGLALL